MAYPFVQLPTFGEFIGRLTSNEYKCSFETDTFPMTDGDGDTHSIHYLKREVDGETIKCVIEIEDFDQRLSFTLLRSVCARLKINVKDFGLTLG
jgi:hypothetical protein